MISFFDISEQRGGLHLLARFFQDGLNFGEEKNHFTAGTTFEEQIGVENAAIHERRCHIPIADHLTEPGVLVGSQGSRRP